MGIKVRGNSGYNLKIVENRVIKSSLTPDLRLIKSAQKQNEFSSAYFKTPKIFTITESSFTMEYINGGSFVDFFNYASKRDLDGLINKFEGYFKERTIGEGFVSTDIIKKKLKDIPESNEMIDYLDEIQAIKIKYGLCHGDLTFSNMIFAEDIYLIDFLDSYMESPTIDVLKLRQDTHLHWGFNMVDTIRDPVKLKLGFKYIDEWIMDTFDIDQYNLLQAINLFRIFPYTNDPKIKEYLTQNIRKLCEHL
jgi:tRNA A-37 threonylcarbamoyl transferase component Bud32